MCDSTSLAVIIGIVSSLVASLYYSTIALCAAWRVRKARAQPFVGTYRMYIPNPLLPTGGTVTISHVDSIWKNLTISAPLLSVFAEHGAGKAPGTEDWEATVEVLGLSEMASGFYRYPNREGGGLRFALSGFDADQIIEYGTPFDQSAPFIRVLIREGVPVPSPRKKTK